MEFFRACLRGDVDRVRCLALHEHVDINAKYDPSKHGDLKIFTGQNAHRGVTGLILAAWEGKADLVRMLLREFRGRLNLAEQHVEGWTALHEAAYHGHLEVVKAFREEVSIDFEMKTGRSAPWWSGSTALLLAAGNGKFEVVEYLLQNNACVFAKNNDGKTALNLAKGDRVKELLKTYETAAEISLWH